MNDPNDVNELKEIFNNLYHQTEEGVVTIVTTTAMRIVGKFRMLQLDRCLWVIVDVSNTDYAVRIPLHIIEELQISYLESAPINWVAKGVQRAFAA